MTPKLLDRDPLPPHALAIAARYLYGEHWQSPLAEALNVAHTTVGRWAAGRHKMTGAALVLLRRLVADKVAIDAATARLME